MSQPSPLFLDVSDLQRIYTGKRCDRWCRDLARTIRDAHGIPKGVPIPARLVAGFIGLKEDEIRLILHKP